MRDELVVLDGSTFCVSDPAGDMTGGGPYRGFFFADTRHLSHWQLLVDGTPIDPLTSRNVDYYSARIVGVPVHTEPDGDRTLTIKRDRIVADGIHEDVSVENHGQERRRVVVELRYAADFADLFEMRHSANGHRTTTVAVDGNEVTMLYENSGFRRGTRLEFSTTGESTAGCTRFELELQPHQRWDLCVDIFCIDGDTVHGPRAGHGGFGELQPHMPETLDEWFDEAPTLDTDIDAIVHTYHQSLLDLAALRFTPFTDDAASVPAAGLPWFMAVFGRDSLIASYMALPFQPRLAKATLETVARMQATDDDPFRDAEPGKIAHELRFGELTVLGEMPHRPYYGSHDVTPLFLVVLDEYERWTGDTELVTRLEPAARAALAWIEGPGDRDCDGYLEYVTRSSKGLLNQCWKDSHDSMLFADGHQAEPPIATCEIQGYAFDARRRMARLARVVWNDDELADRLDADADALAKRFAEDFWCSPGGYSALALDRDKARVDSLTSNVGHLLWSGILSDDHAKQVAQHLMSADLFSGWGVRTMAASAAGYNPIAYHNGTVWPHDTALIAEGLRRYGFRDEASQLALALFDAAERFEHRLPECFAGFDRDATTVPIAYPHASRPQAWSAAAPLLALRTLLGLDVVDGELRASASLPSSVGQLGLRGVQVHGARVDAD